MADAVISYAPWRNTAKGVGQWYVHQSQARFRTLMAGRQSGKTMTGIAEIGIDAMSHGGHIDWWVAPSYKVKDRAWRGLLEFIPKAVIAKKNETELLLRLTNGSEIRVKSADAQDSLVSEGLDFAVCDEAGLWKEDAWIRGIRPMFTATKGRALLLGTPRGRNWFYRVWQMGREGTQKDPNYDSFQWSSIDSPFSDPLDIAEAKRNIPSDIFRQEYEADPLDNTQGVFHNVRACIRTHALPDPLTVIGVDFARKRDFSCFIPMNSARQALSVHRSQEEWPVQKQQLAALSMYHSFARIVADEANIGDPIISEMRQAGFQVEGYPTNSAPKKISLINHLRLAFDNGTIGIPDDPILLDELEAYEYVVLTDREGHDSGKLSYGAPGGKNDDTVIALALALWGQRATLGIFAPNRVPSSYMGSAIGAGSYMQSNRRAASWPL